MTVARMAQGEIEREARRVLRKLANDTARLVAWTDGGYALMTSANADAKPCLRLSAAVFDAFRGRGWIEPRAADGASILSDAGRGWLEREAAVGDPFVAQHRLLRRGEIVDEGGAPRTVVINDGESPLGWLRRRRGADGNPLISKTQFVAGERLRADSTLAQLSPRMAVDLTAPVVAGRRGAKAQDLSDIALAAKQRFTRALVSVGLGLSDVLIDVCCHLIGLEDAERRKGWPQRSAKIVLQLVLDRLALHNGLGPAFGTGSRFRVWRAPDDEGGEDAAREP